MVELKWYSFERFLGAPSLDLAAKSVAILGIAACLAIVLKRSPAAVRHFVWFLGMASLLALPGLTQFLPSLPIRVPRTALGGYLEAKNRELQSVNPPAPGTPGTGVGIHNAGFTAQSDSRRQGEATEQAGNAASRRPFDWIEWRGVIWLTGSFLVLVPLLIGTLVVLRIRDRAEPVRDEAISALVEKSCQEFGIERPVELFSTTSITMPVTWGFRRHVILLPDLFHDWVPERQQLVLLHELAHIRRMDCLTQLIAWSVCSLFWFNPLTWLAVRRMRVERERACDDMVINQGIKPSHYAAHLLEIAQGAYGMTSTSIAAVAIARPSELEGRLLTIMDSKRNRGNVPKSQGIFALTLLSGTLVLVAACKTIQADERGASNKPGNNYHLDRKRFDSIAPLSKISAISGEGGFSMSLSNGVVWSWGFNGNGRLGDGSTINRETPVRVEGLSNIVQIVGGGTFGAALTKDSTVWCWGANDVGQLGNGSYKDSHTPVQVLYHPDYQSAYPEFYNTGFLSNVVEIAAGTRHCMALRSIGDVMYWGYNGIYHNEYARVPHGKDPLGIIHISSGDSHDLLLSSAGVVYAWGENNYGQVGNNSQIDIYAPGVAVLSNIVAIATGRYHSLALDNQSNVWAWGLNDFGQLGITNQLLSKIPIRTGVTNAVAISAGNGYSMALLSDNSVIGLGQMDVWNTWSQRLAPGPLAANLSLHPPLILSLLVPEFRSDRAGEVKSSFGFSNR
ncbi:MAG: antirepressor regulating drug resistance protein [Verrucomicrobiales bacterium]|nr:antirepressor regulating drug resistance protein [Verrucomicrobiales bacterium]